jgi:hypothetical protein
MSISVGSGIPKPPVDLCHPCDSEPSVARHFGREYYRWMDGHGPAAETLEGRPCIRWTRVWMLCDGPTPSRTQPRAAVEPALEVAAQRDSPMEKAPKSASASRSLRVNEPIRGDGRLPAPVLLSERRKQIRSKSTSGHLSPRISPARAPVSVNTRMTEIALGLVPARSAASRASPRLTCSAGDR